MADKRWKQVERGAAEELNRVLSGIGNFTPVERIPLLGREGPDLTVNETGLVINVKSRKCIPGYLFPPAGTFIHSGKLIIFRLNDIITPLMKTCQVDQWKQLVDWYALMDKWTQEFQPDAISAIFLHRPRLPYGSMGVAIHHEHLRRLSCNLTTH
jgi:hypothetical protein